MAKSPATTQVALHITAAKFTAPKKQHTHRFLKPLSNKARSVGTNGIEMLSGEFTRLVLKSALVLIVVGSNNVVFRLPKNLICAKSSFFDKALNGAFQEGVDQTINLPEDDPTTFELLVYWMFYDHISPVPGLPGFAAAVVTSMARHHDDGEWNGSEAI